MKANAQPSDGHKNEALQWAADHFRRNTHNLKPGGILEELGERYTKLLRDGFIQSAIDGIEVGLDDWGAPGMSLDEGSTRHVNSARQGKKVSTKISFELAATLIEQGKELPRALRDFIVEYLRNPNARRTQKPGRKSDALVWRNADICFAISTICLKWKFPATRNDATKGKRASAASIVREALEKAGSLRLTEEAINKIWGTSQFNWNPTLRRHRAVGKNADD